jgi:hypothetical protein
MAAAQVHGTQQRDANSPLRVSLSRVTLNSVERRDSHSAAAPWRRPWVGILMWARQPADVPVTSTILTANDGGSTDLWAPLQRGFGTDGAYTASLKPVTCAVLKGRVSAGEEPSQLGAGSWNVSGRV